MPKTVVSALLAAILSAAAFSSSASTVATADVIASNYAFSADFSFVQGSAPFAGNLLLATYGESGNTGWVESLTYSLTGPGNAALGSAPLFDPIMTFDDLNPDASRSASIVVDGPLIAGQAYNVHFAGMTSGSGYGYLGNGVVSLSFLVPGGSAATVPEPTTGALLLAALGVMGGIARRRAVPKYS